MISNYGTRSRVLLCQAERSQYNAAERITTGNIRATFALSCWFHKGDMCIVSGRLESRDWQDKNGNKRRSWEVQCESIDFCGGKSEGKPKENSDFADMPEEDSDVPF